MSKKNKNASGSRRGDARELLNILRRRREHSPLEASDPDVPKGCSSDSSSPFQRKFVQWTSTDGKIYVPAASSVAKMRPGLYEIRFHPNIGIYFENVTIHIDDLIRFPETNIDRVVAEVERFWGRENLFKAYNLCFKRGIMMWGPPGSGKSCALQLALADIIKREGVVFKFGEPALFRDGMRAFREIQPDTPVIAIMEDLDDLVRHGNEQPILQILDGVDSVERTIFIATTNYPERLGERVLNRPSRFDRIFKIGMPGEQSRAMYIESLVGRGKKAGVLEARIDARKWVRDTEGFSFAHLRELFIGVALLGDPYEEVVETLREMGQPISSNSDRKAGFKEE
jgi:hypothetical protein